MSEQNVDIFSVLVPGMVLPTVQLRHDLPDGSWHVDWMISYDQTGSGELIAFRLPDSLKNLQSDSLVRLSIERSDDHRSLYLDYEGPISGNRGNVTRVSAGKTEIESNTGDSLQMKCIWKDGDEPPILINLRPDSLKPDNWFLELAGK